MNWRSLIFVACGIVREFDVSPERANKRQELCGKKVCLHEDVAPLDAKVERTAVDARKAEHGAKRLTVNQEELNGASHLKLE